MDSKAVRKVLQADGWQPVRQKGSHLQFRHATKKGVVTLTHPKKNIPKGTLRNIFRQAGLPFPR